jgi:putative ABC transport system permease protein
MLSGEGSLGQQQDSGSTVGDLFTHIWHDVKFGLRMLRKNPGFSLAAIFTLALGIGGNTAIFTITNALLLRALPYQDPQQLVMLEMERKSTGQQGGDLTLNAYELIRDHSRSFSGVSVWAIDSLNLTGRGEPEQVPVARVSPNFFGVLGVNPQIGRTFSTDEGQPGGKPVVMISDGLWHARFGGDAQVVGQTITLDSTPYTIIGVLPPDVRFPFVGPADVWSPRYFELSLMTPERLRSGVGYLTGVARLAPGSSIKSANAELDVLHRQYSLDNPKAPDAGPEISMTAGNLQELTVANIHTLLLILSLAVGLVLMIACANVASLLLSRALARSKEIAIRSALGARRSTIVRQLLTESIVLALISGALGLALGTWGTRWLGQLGTANLPQGFSFAMDARVLLFTLVISLFTGTLFGLFPAIKLAWTNVNSELRDEARGTTGGQRRMQAKNLLVVTQIALCVVLLIGAALMVRSFARLQRVNLGFDPGNVVSMNVSLPTLKYPKGDTQVAFFDELLRRVNAVPGVKSASISAALPLTPRRITPVLPEGQPEVPLAQRPFVIVEAIGTDWFRTMGVPVKMGRSFSDHDHADAPRVVIVNEALARRFWPNENPIGKHIVVGRQTAAEVVGVALGVKNNGLAVDSQPQIYLPFPQLPWTNMNLLVRTASDPHQFVSTIRQQVYSVDPDQPVTRIQTMDELLDASRSQPRFTMFLLATLSGVALILSVIGIYGVIAYTVAQRRPELGIRLALGARQTDILRLVVSQGVFLTVTGVVIGLMAALAGTRLMASLLFEVKTHDITTFILAPAVFLLIGLIASYVPARQATRVDPSEVLRG